MSKKKRVVTSRESDKKKQATRKGRKGGQKEDDSFQLLFNKENYKWVGIGIVLLIAGFLLMLGGEQSSPDVWEPEKIYSFRRITLAPLLILAGLGVQIYAIFRFKK